MLDIGWSELLLIGIVALIVVGPKDLPGMFRTLGRFTAKARAMGREFSRAMEDAAKDSGLDEATRDLKSMTSKKGLGLDALDKAADAFEKWQPKVPATPKGPATQALADQQRAAAEARLAAQSAVTPPADAAAATPTARVARPVTRKSAAPKAPAAHAAAAGPAATTAAAATDEPAAKSAAPAPRASKTGDA
ncbi:MAG: Sec-independent protein translocase protein TatB [Pseudomonadota bacterium]